MPQILQQLMGYTAGGAGEALSTGGLATILMMPLVGFLMGKVDPRKLVVCGYLLMGFGLFYVAQIYIGVSFAWVAKARFIQSLGLAFLFVPISTLAYVGTRPEQSNDVSGTTNLARNVGGSIGTSFVTTFAARWGQTHQAYLARHVNAGNVAWVGRLNALTQQSKGVLSSTADAQHRAMAQFYQQSLSAQASILAYKDITHFFAIAMFVMAPLALLMTRPPKGTAAAAH